MPAEHLVHLVDDEEAIRLSAGFLLRTNGYVVKSYVSGVAFLADADRETRGCVLLDIRMPELDGLEVQRRLSERGIEMPVIMLTGHGDVALAVRAIKAGAVEFLEKPFQKAALLAAIEEAFRRVDDADRIHLDAAEAVIRLAALTPREGDVLQGIVQGQPNKITAYELGISIRTVEAHRAALMVKLHARSLSEVLRIAFAAGLGERG
ncbi:response regulator transcription factor [Sphingomonas psychrolutea]|uniref:DNA-binding response regulator n=1 Tax=Sphingomonas psychrolutea TaxID=1259676 RepID=A0ABQ1H7W6_9SPHN|nr:response regulator [Sphingomonas psychrolutea]GGA60376.1 DNA-binding response regulator [Sphingomonas psychrolutea]